MVDEPTIEVTTSSPVVVCQDCGLIFSLLPNHLVGTNDSLQLYSITTNHQEVYCSKCLEQLVRSEMREIQMLEERYIYQKQFQSFQGLQLHHPQLTQEHLQPPEQLKEQIHNLQAEDLELTASLSKIRGETSELKEKILIFEIEEEKFWEGINKIQRRTHKVEEKSLNTKFDKHTSRDKLEQLSRLSIIHLFTDITIEDNAAYVHGIAMGKKAEGAEISWQEVAVGLGHLLVSLNFLVLKYGYEYQLIERVRYSGMQSEIVLKSKKRRLYLFYSRDNQKMVGELLQTLLIETAKLSDHMLQAQSVQYSQEFRIPFLMNVSECKIAELFIDPFKMDERLRWASWTKVMRYYCINFKHLLTVFAINDKHL